MRKMAATGLRPATYPGPPYSMTLWRTLGAAMAPPLMILQPWTTPSMMPGVIMERCETLLLAKKWPLIPTTFPSFIPPDGQPHFTAMLAAMPSSVSMSVMRQAPVVGTRLTMALPLTVVMRCLAPPTGDDGAAAEDAAKGDVEDTGADSSLGAEFTSRSSDTAGARAAAYATADSTDLW